MYHSGYESYFLMLNSSKRVEYYNAKMTANFNVIIRNGEITNVMHQLLSDMMTFICKMFCAFSVF